MKKETNVMTSPCAKLNPQPFAYLDVMLLDVQVLEI